eukprot:Gb_00630 [translate_table: standard]
MAAEFWSSRFTAAKHQNALQSTQSHTDQYLSFNDMEGDDDIQADFPCPLCYVDCDITSLCRHLEDEHCFESKNAICPVCAANIGKDMVGHIKLHHSHLFKVQRRRRFPKEGVPSNPTLSVLGKELREGQLHSGLRGASCGGSSNAAPDPLLSSFVYSMAMFETEEQQKPSSAMEESSTKNPSSSQAIISVDSSVTDEEGKQMFEEDVQRAEYVQQLLLSAILCGDF